MVQFRLLAWRWKIQVQEFSEQIWRSSKFGLSVILAGSLLYLYWAFHIPSPGKAVAALAVAAAIMTFRGEIGGLEKFFWMAMLFVFLFMELRAIDHDRAIYSAEQVKARREEAAAFDLHPEN
jgi:hypothetical protein